MLSDRLEQPADEDLEDDEITSREAGFLEGYDRDRIDTYDAPEELWEME